VLMYNLVTTIAKTFEGVHCYNAVSSYDMPTKSVLHHCQYKPKDFRRYGETEDNILADV